jgi:Na+/proline symporter
MLGGLLLAMFWKSGSAKPVIVGMISSLLVMISISSLVFPRGWFHANVQIAWPWYTLIGTTVTVCVAWLIRLLTRATSPETNRASE